MAILKNTVFEGSPIYDVDPGSETWARTLATAQGDLAGCLALLTDNTETDHINHSGAGRGALLGVPWVNQAMGVGLGLDTGGAKNGGVVAGDLYNFFHLIRIEPGETEVVVDITIATLPVPRSEAHAFGCVHVDETGRIIGFVEKPKDPPGNRRR